MAFTLMQLQAQRDALWKAKVSGALRVSYDGKTIEYRSLADIDRAIAAVDEEIQALSGTPVARVVRTYGGKGTC